MRAAWGWFSPASEALAEEGGINYGPILVPCGFCFLPVLCIIVFPGGTRVLSTGFEDDLKVCAHVDNVVVICSESGHVSDEAASPLCEGVVEFMPPVHQSEARKDEVVWLLLFLDILF